MPACLYRPSYFREWRRPGIGAAPSFFPPLRLDHDHRLSSLTMITLNNIAGGSRRSGARRSWLVITVNDIDGAALDGDLGGKRGAADGVDNRRLACTRQGRVLNKGLALAWCECQPHGNRRSGVGRGGGAPLVARDESRAAGGAGRRGLIRPDRRARTRAAVVLEGANNTVQEDNAEWPRLSRSTRMRAAVSSGA